MLRHRPVMVLAVALIAVGTVLVFVSTMGWLA